MIWYAASTQGTRSGERRSNNVLGIVLGLGSAFLWATASLAIKAQSDRFDTSSFNAFRMFVGTLFMLVLLPFFGSWQALTQVPTK